MERWIFYIPPAAFGLAAFVLSRRSPKLNDSRLFRDPTRRPWSPTQWFDDSRFTEEGIAVRNRHVVNMCIAAGVGLLAWIAILMFNFAG